MKLNEEIGQHTRRVVAAWHDSLREAAETLTLPRSQAVIIGTVAMLYDRQPYIVDKIVEAAWYLPERNESHAGLSPRSLKTIIEEYVQ